MDIFEGRFFRLNKILLTIIGFHPFGSKSNIIIRPLLTISSFLMMVPHVISAAIHQDNIDRFMLNLLSVLTISVMFLKMVALKFSEQKFEDLYNSISNNFRTIRDEEERKVLISYSERGRLLTIIYGVMMAVSGSTISSLPGFPAIADRISPLDKPRPKIYLMDGEYFFERTNYPVVAFLCDSATTITVAVITMAVDSMYMASAEHACALYAILSYRFRNLKGTDGVDSTTEDNSYEQVRTTMILHQEALRFTSTLSDSYSMTFLFVMIVDLALIPLVACAIIANLHTWVGFMPYILLFNAITIHLLMIFYPGQRILDHGNDLCLDSYYNDWYAMSYKTKKLLLIFKLRSSQPASLSGGGLFLIDIQTFVMIMKTSVSYITVLASFRG